MICEWFLASCCFFHTLTLTQHYTNITVTFHTLLFVNIVSKCVLVPVSKTLLFGDVL